MDKEEILAKSREENRNGDERDREIANQAAMYGFIGIVGSLCGDAAAGGILEGPGGLWL